MHKLSMKKMTEKKNIIHGPQLKYMQSQGFLSL